jgi:hypothetical protein
LKGSGGPPVFLLGIAVFAGAAVWLDIAGRNDRRARALAGVYWTSAASFAHDLTLGLLGLHILPVDLTVVQSLRPEALFPVFLWQFARDFPNVTRFGIVDRLSKVGVGVASVAGLTLFVANINVHASAGPLIPWLSVLDRSYEQGRWFWMIVFVTAVAAFVCVVVRGELAQGTERTRVRQFLWSIVAALAPVAIIVLVESTVPAFASFMRTPTGRVIGASLVYPAMFGLPVLTSYIVLAHDVLNVRAVAQRALRYLLTRWLVAWGTSVPIVILAMVVYVHRTEPLADVLSTPHARLLVWMAAAGAALLACRAPILRAIDRWMLDEVSDPAGMLAELGSELRSARTLTEVATLVAGAAERTLQTGVDVYFIDDDAIVRAVHDEGAPPPDSLVPVLLQGASGPCVVDSRARGSYYALLSRDDRRWIQREGIMALCPIMPSGASRVRAVIALKARRNALALSRADLQFLTAVCASAALAHSRLEQIEDGSAPLQEDLGLQCSKCARVETWRLDAARCDCGGVWERAALPGIVAGRFRLTGLLGSGGMGVVYKAQDVVLHRDVAIKTLPHLSADAADRLLEEARTMAALTHSHIAVLYSAEQWRGTPVLMVEYLAGGTLARRLHGEALPTDVALEIGITLGDTLAYMHGTNRSHGDIKPSNIAFTAQGVTKFLDFGLSRVLQEKTGDDRPAGGTLAYLSPEVLAGDSPGPAADVWALSVVLFQALAGYHPFLDEERTVARIRAGFRDAARLRACVQPPIANLLCGLLSATPADRPATAAEFRDRLEGVRNELRARSLT